ncbi:ABC transporter ATP-binding protein [Acrocarpospora macrocephala]|uniref:ABC-type quaternary amine transporter n=1 Tax=Acrocarpospora macrocephala TaxID=150177 RepID=A0A5M3WYD7_9ACTN|nr:ABC transporter ATP-binding protein [Acrocarpospora macrocephala]GES12351.1 polyamine-transporting ATPase [Acrocarpospora macrocephala]
MSSRPDRPGAPVQLSGVSKWYGAKQVLRGISLSVASGSFTSLLGPSGSGKTTTLGTVAGLVKADQGSVLIDDRDVTRVKMEHRDIGFVFQNYALFPHMTIAKNVAFPLRMRRLDRRQISTLVHEALERVRLDGLGHRYPSELSGGQSQRAALARAIVFRPRALLLDEPLGALDAALRTYLQREIVEIAREINATVLYVTHDQQEALSMSDQVVLFRDGAIEQFGTPHSLYHAPQTRFSAQFIGAGCLLDGVAAQTGGGWCLVRPTGEKLALGNADLTEGAAVGVQIRPEMVRANEISEPVPAGWNLLGIGRVTDMIFKGEYVQNLAELTTGECVEWRTTDMTPNWRPGTHVNLLLSEQTALNPIVEPVAGPQINEPVSANPRAAVR